MFVFSRRVAVKSHCVWIQAVKFLQQFNMHFRYGARWHRPIRVINQPQSPKNSADRAYHNVSICGGKSDLTSEDYDVNEI